MGRRKKYFTEDEKKNANRIKVKEYYWRHKNNIDEKAKNYYWYKKDLMIYSQQILKKEQELGFEMSKQEREQYIEELKLID